jgi:dTMP kinase
MALAFAADRADHIFNTFNGVEKTLAGGAWVLCDRYVMSSLAYQSSGTVSSAWLRDINAFALEPDATLFVDTSPEICMERLTLRSFNQDLYHELGELQSVMKRYQQVLSAGGLLGPLLTVNGSEPPDQVHAEVMLKLGPYLNSWQETSQDATPTGA